MNQKPHQKADTPSVRFMTKYEADRFAKRVAEGEDRARLRRLALQVRGVHSQDSGDMLRLADALDAIANGDDPVKVLGVGKPAHCPLKSITMEWTEEIAPVFEVRRRMRDKQLLKKNAMDEIAKERHIGDHALKTYYRRHWRMAQWMLDSMEQSPDSVPPSA